MNNAAQIDFLWSRISLPLIGVIGKVSKKAPMIHIAKPVPPITLEPLSRRRLKTPAKANDKRIEAEDRTAAMRFVSLGP